MKKLYLSLLLLFIIPVSLMADTWQVFTQGQGLADNNVHCFTAMKTYMAVGTNSGASVYNGETSSWQQLKLPDEVASNPVKDIAFDQNGHLWVASARGLVHIQGEDLYLYGVEHGLPTVDVDRIQIQKNKIFAGCFGGYVCQAEIPLTGRTAFLPANYRSEDISDSFKMRSVGVSALGMVDQSKGWISTTGEGLIEQIGPNAYPLNGIDGMPEGWVNDFWVFQGPSRATHILSITPEHISLIKNSNTFQEVMLPVESPWLNCIIAVKENPDIFTCLELPKMNEEEKSFFKFLNGRSLFVGTRNHGLWRYQMGVWTNYTSTSSSLPSNCVNRLYLMGRTLVMCTDGGLAICSLDSHQYDEFKNQGIGNIYAKTLFPMPPTFAYMVPFHEICKGTCFWFSHHHGLSRWRPASRPKIRETDRTNDLSSRLEILRDETDEFLNFGEPENPEDSMPDPDIATEDIISPAVQGYWQLFSNRYMLSYDTEIILDSDGETEIKTNDLYPIYSEKITSMTIDKNTDMLWLIFDDKYLAKMQMKPKIVQIGRKKIRREMPEWVFMGKYQPWADGLELKKVWFNDNKLYIGTKEDGFYILKNPQSTDLEKNPYEWAHYGIYEGLTSSDVIGFARYKSLQADYLAILHNKRISLWDGEMFTEQGTGAERQYTCIAGGDDGNLWIGSYGGLFRVTPTGAVRSYTTTDAWFESNLITAVATIKASSGRETGVWVACDALFSTTQLNPLLNGSDQPPNVYRMPDGSKVVKELDIDGSSMHFFDGRTWEKWKMAGIKYIFIDGDFIWTTSNIRVRRILAPR
ncbi:MAG: hypothetical protein ACOYXC_15795 [Candidatus Rifleibacteriota bacterium]